MVKLMIALAGAAVLAAAMVYGHAVMAREEPPDEGSVAYADGTAPYCYSACDAARRITCEKVVTDCVEKEAAFVLVPGGYVLDCRCATLASCFYDIGFTKCAGLCMGTITDD